VKTSQGITIVIWATIILIIYEYLKGQSATASASTGANLLGVPTTTGNSTLDQQLLQMSTQDAAAGAAAQGTPAIYDSALGSFSDQAAGGELTGLGTSGLF